MTHPCAGDKPPSWCSEKRRRKTGSTVRANAARKARKAAEKLSKKNLGSVTPAQIAAHLKSHGVKITSKKTCTIQSGPRKNRLKKGCFYGRGALKGKILKKTKTG